MSRLFSFSYLPVQPRALAEEENLDCLGPKNIRLGEKELVRECQGDRGVSERRLEPLKRL